MHNLVVGTSEEQTGPNMAVDSLETARDDFTQDGTVDLKGNPVLRSKRGGWKACSFVVGKATLLCL